VPQHVERQYAKVILGREDTHGLAAKIDAPRPRIHLVERAIVEIGAPRMDVDQVRDEVESLLERRNRAIELRGGNDEVDVARRSQSTLRIVLRDGPAFDQDRLDSTLSKEGKDFSNTGFVEGSEKD